MEDLEKTIARKNQKMDKDERDVLLMVRKLFEEHKNVRDGDWKAAHIEFLNKHQFLTAKPVVYLVNISVENYVSKKNKWLPKVQKWI